MNLTIFMLLWTSSSHDLCSIKPGDIGDITETRNTVVFIGILIVPSKVGSRPHSEVKVEFGGDLC